MDAPELRSRSDREPLGDSYLYLGVSDRPRGWKSRTSRHQCNEQLPAAFKTRKWDGAARRAFQWDHLLKDPDLWCRNGDCFVHLYSKGQSQRGPAFKIPLSTLTSLKCQPLLDRFLDRSIPEFPEQDDSARTLEVEDSSMRIDLYMSAPAGCDRDQAFQHHLTTRNFFAWLLRRSVVGETLSEALVGLMYSMHAFRLSEADNVRDLIDYLDEEGYLEMSDQPGNALAILIVAETFRLRDLYVEAFAHCVGMYSRLFSNLEYQLLSSTSRKALRHASTQQINRLDSAGSMLRTFLEDELAEANLGLPAPARAHLDRFRTFLLTFYATKYGYYPPPSMRPGSTTFKPEVYLGMLNDFRALYEYLVDESFTSGESGPPLAQGGICALQCLHAFESRCGRSLLAHPLPLLPGTRTTGNSARPTSRTISWLEKGADKLRPDSRHESFALLMKATNKTKIELLENRLVCAYRRFEHDLIFSPLRSDQRERISHVDARKVRWILIYCVLQTLRDCAGVLPGVRDPETASYLLSVANEDLPAWTRDAGSSTAPPFAGDWVVQLPPPSIRSEMESLQSTPMSIEIKPDIDYFALTGRSGLSSSSIVDHPTALPTTTGPSSGRTMGLTRSLSRNSTLRRSLALFQTPPPPEVTPAVRPRRRRALYHEIVVLGYGNGTNAVNMSRTDAGTSHTPISTTRSPSTASSNSSVGTRGTEPSMAGTDETVDSMLTVPDSVGDDINKNYPSSSSKVVNHAQEERPQSSKSHSRRAVSPEASILATQDRTGTPPIPAKSRARRCVSMIAPSTTGGDLRPAPLQIRKVEGTESSGPGDSPPPPLRIDTSLGQEQGMDVWDQYGNIGGHTPLELVRVRGRLGI